MKKRLIGTLLLGALFVSSTSMFVSCKDYDDDINNVSDRVTVLEAAKVDLENEIAKLRADLEANYATKVALANAEDALNKSILAEKARAEAAEAALSTRIQTAQDAIDDLNTLIGGDISKSANFADCKTYKEALEKTWAKIESVETGLGNRLTALETDLNLDDPSSKIRLYLKNLENQIAALEAWQAGLDKDGGAATKNYVGTEIAAAEGRAAIDAAQKAAQALVDAKQYTNEEINKAVVQVLKDAADDAKKKADAAEAAAKSFAQDKANEAEANAKKYAAEEAKAKADAAQAAAEKYAKEYADQKYNDALTEAQKMANAAEAAAKGYADELLVQAKAYADKVGANTLTAAQNYADQKIAIAKAEAIAKAQELADAAESAAKSYTDDEITKLKNNELKALSDRIDALQGELNILNMFLRQLRSIVFIPKGYIDGVEAMKLLTLNYSRFYANPDYLAVNGSNFFWFDGEGNFFGNKGYRKIESKYSENFTKANTAADPAKDRNADHDRYNQQSANGQAKVFTRTLDFTAEYWMNPSNADKSLIKNVQPASEDLWFESTRRGKNNAAAGFFMKSWEAENGILKVNYGLQDVNKIKANDEITVFATYVTYGDTVITSDYATLKNEAIDSLVLAINTASPAVIKKANDELVTKNTHCGFCSINSVAADSTHLFATITEAAGKTNGGNVKSDNNYKPQFKVNYNNITGVDLESLIEVHASEVVAPGLRGKHFKVTDPAGYGLSYRFELTGLIYESNGTSESAHAVIVYKDKNGNVVDEDTEGAKPYLIPWMPSKKAGSDIYEQTPFDASKADQFQTKQLVGRTPLVRVSLVLDNKEILDYGYIRFEIEDNDVTPVDPVDEYRKFVSFDGNGWSVTYPDCGNATFNDYNWGLLTWIDTEWDILNVLGISQGTYLEDYYVEKDANGVKQYVLGAISETEANKAIFTAATANGGANLGTINEIANPDPRATDVYSWEIAANATEGAFVNSNKTAKSNVSVAFRMVYNPGKGPKGDQTIAVGDQGYGTSANVNKDLYIVLKAGTITVTQADKLTATINQAAWNAKKLRNYWYERNDWNPSDNGVEVHAQTLTPEDDALRTVQVGYAKTLQSDLQSVFVGNKVKGTNAEFDGLWTMSNNTKAAHELTWAWQFVKGDFDKFLGIYEGIERQFVTFPGNSAATVLKNGNNTYAGLGGLIKDDVHLYAFLDLNTNGVWNIDEPVQLIAVLGPQTPGAAVDINTTSVFYQHTGFAEAMLNYKGRKELTDKVLTAYLKLKAEYMAGQTHCAVPVTMDPIQVRFIRPINVDNVANEGFVDASVNNATLNLRDLVNLSDWRLEGNGINAYYNPFKTNYWYYYNVKAIEVVGTDFLDPNEQNIADNNNKYAKTNLSNAVGVGDCNKLLSEVSTQVQFSVQYPGQYPTLTPNAAPLAGDYGVLKYTNLGSTVQEFDIELTLRILYEWGGIQKETTLTDGGKGGLYVPVKIHIGSSQSRRTK